MNNHRIEWFQFTSDQPIPSAKETVYAALSQNLWGEGDQLAALMLSYNLRFPFFEDFIFRLSRAYNRAFNMFCAENSDLAVAEGAERSSLLREIHAHTRNLVAPWLNRSAIIVTWPSGMLSPLLSALKAPARGSLAPIIERLEYPLPWVFLNYWQYGQPKAENPYLQRYSSDRLRHIRRLVDLGVVAHAEAIPPQVLLNDVPVAAIKQFVTTATGVRCSLTKKSGQLQAAAAELPNVYAFIRQHLPLRELYLPVVPEWLRDDELAEALHYVRYVNDFSRMVTITWQTAAPSDIDEAIELAADEQLRVVDPAECCTDCAARAHSGSPPFHPGCVCGTYVERD